LSLSLGFPVPNRGDDELKAMVAGVEGMTFRVETWAFGFEHTDKTRADSLRALNQRFLVRQDTAALFAAGARSEDTLRVAVGTAYEKAGGRDSVQVFSLPNLRKKLQEGSEAGRQWMVLLQLTYMPEDSADTAAMLRFGGNHGVPFSPSLLFGNPAGTAKHPATATTKQRVGPLTLAYQNTERRGVASVYRHDGSPTALLTGKTRGLHLRLDRGLLLDSLDQALKRLGTSLARASDGEFDLAYYVPFAQLTLPLAGPSVIEGNFPVDMRLFSDLDSLLPGETTSIERLLPKGQAEVLSVLSERNTGRVTDSVIARFEDVEGVPGLDRFILWGKDTTRKDTVFLREGESREVLRNRLVISLQVQGDNLAYRLHLNSQSQEEEYRFRDAATGDLVSDIAKRIPRFLKPEDTRLTLRATRGFQRMLNRARLGQEIQGDFFIQPTRNAAADPAANLLVPYTVFGEIEPAIESGRLGVDIVIYLYPLKAR
jgi:hypothetical protein